MTTISPSILSADFSHLGADCRMVLDAGAQMLHYDVMDGHFVPNISFGVPVLKSLHKGMPAAFYDVHLMISDPVRYAPDFAKALSGADSVILLDIYPARELPIPGVTSEIIFDKVTSPEKELVAKDRLVATLAEKGFDVLLTVGAGDICNLLPEIIKLPARS